MATKFETISKRVNELEAEKAKLEGEYLENLTEWISSNVAEPFKSRLISALSGKRRGRKPGQKLKPRPEGAPKLGRPKATTKK